MESIPELVDYSQSPTVGKIAEALSKAQAEMKGAVKDSANPHLKNKYADLASVWDAWRPCGPKNGLAIVQPPGTAENGVAKVTTVLLHTSGEWIRSTLAVSYEGNKGVNAAQAMGSAITYARRYALAATVGIAPEDDDGSNAGPPRHQSNGHHSEPLVSQDQRATLADLASKTTDRNMAGKTILSKFRVRAIAELPARHFEEAATILRNMAAPHEPEPGDAYEGEPANLMQGDADYPG